MPATTYGGSHIITVGELQEMLSKCDPRDRIMFHDQPIDRVVRAGEYWSIRCGERHKLPAIALKK